MATDSTSNIAPASGGFNPTTGGVSPAGVVPVPVAGMAALTTTPLAANAVWASGIKYYNGATAVDYQIVSDVAGTFSVVYYDANGNALPFVPANVPYDPAIVKSFGSAFNAKGYGFSFTFTNGAVAQTQFLVSIGLSQGVQATQQSAITAVTDTNLALVAKGTLQAKENATGSRKELTGTINGSKFGLDVNVVNPVASQTVTGTVSVANPTDVSTLAKETGGNLAAILTALNSINTDQGAPTDAQATSSTATWGEIALLKGILQRPATGTTVSNTTLATVTTVLAANPLRKGATMFSVTGTILVLLGAGASNTLFTARLITNGYYEVPFGYTGIITAIGAGTLLVTELS